jgi:anti-sigma factor RsiW
MAGILKSLAASTAAAIGRSDLALRLGKSTSYARALRNEHAGIGDEPATPAAIYAAAAQRMDGPQPMTFGTLHSGARVRVRRELGLMSALILGATGMGKSRLLIALLLEPLRKVIDELRLDTSPAC